MIGRCVREGAIVEITTSDGRKCQMRIVGLKDGRVSFQRAKGQGRSASWWLPYEDHKQWKLIKPAAPEAAHA